MTEEEIAEKMWWENGDMTRFLINRIYAPCVFQRRLLAPSFLAKGRPWNSIFSKNAQVLLLSSIQNFLEKLLVELVWTKKF